MRFARLDGGDVSLVISWNAGMSPKVIYWGKKLSPDIDMQMLDDLSFMQGTQGNTDTSIDHSLAMEYGLGLLAAPGLSAHREGIDWAQLYEVVDAECTPQKIVLKCHDQRTQTELRFMLTMDGDTGILTASSSITNNGSDILDIADMASATLPIPAAMTDIVGFTGRWAMEFHAERFKRPIGSWLRENRRGRTSHDSFPGVILCDANCDEATGEAYGLHLAWSSNHRMRVETLSDGRAFVAMGTLLLPGELRLKPGETHENPAVIAGYTDAGLNSLSQKFHAHLKQNILPATSFAKPRPVHYNCWEAVYFNHDIDQLKNLASKAANLGVERFVLDDGWFGSRRHDKAGLGDWDVSEEVYPDGLHPLIDHIIGEGMEMGIWFEPEMVNPDSDLYRAHPDWVLEVEGIEQVPFRNQYVLDISRQEAADYLFKKIDAILTEYSISYIKWDMNRDLNHPGDNQGRPRAMAQVKALYALIDRIRSAHPDVEIESCSSGGGRIDYGILQRTDRVWTSDTNDAIDRQLIQRGASYFLPLQVMGAHVGPHDCHITGRTLPMAFRAATAMVGHMGLELNLLQESEDQLEELKAAIALYKEHRELLHSGDFYRIDSEDHFNIVAIVDKDKSEALYSVAQLISIDKTMPTRLRFQELDPTRNYHLRLIWPNALDNRGYASVFETLDIRNLGESISGQLLSTHGLQLPQMHPATAMIFHLRASN